MTIQKASRSATKHSAKGGPDEPLPAPYRALLQRISPLNRVHNGDEMEEAVRALSDFCSKHLRGEVHIHAYQPGTSHNHWIVPRRWKVKDFRVQGPDGRVVLDKSSHPLALCPYSCPADELLSRDELLERTITRADRPNSFSFYFRRMYRHWESGWNISLPGKIANRLPAGEYRVVIDTELTDEPMLLFEYVVKGHSGESILLVSHLDHPGMTNDSLSGCIAALQAVQALEREQTHYTYRVWLVPEIIGTAVHLKNHEHLVEQALFALCPNMTSHPAPLALCLSKCQHSMLDLAMTQALAESRLEHVVGEFHKYPDCGDEISLDTVGYDIPASTLSRIGEMFEFYHCSEDDLDSFLREDWQKRHQEFVGVLVKALGYVERNRSIKPTFAGNPCLSNPAIDLYLAPSNVNNVLRAEGVYNTLRGEKIDLRNFMEFFLDAIARDRPTVLEIARAANLPFDFVLDYATRFADKKLAVLELPDRARALTTVSRTSLVRAGLV